MTFRVSLTLWNNFGLESRQVVFVELLVNSYTLSTQKSCSKSDYTY